MNTTLRVEARARYRATIRAATLLTLGALLSVAHADTPSRTAPFTRSVKVSLADLDLTTAEGKRAAHDRLHDVARRVCSQVADNFDLSHQPNFVACVQQTWVDALRQADSQLLLASRRQGR